MDGVITVDPEIEQLIKARLFPDQQAVVRSALFQVQSRIRQQTILSAKIAGDIVPLGRAHSRRQAYAKMVDMTEPAAGKTVGIRVAYICAAAQEGAEELKGMIEACLYCVEPRVAKLSQALGVRTGPGTARVCYAPVVDCS